MVFGSSRGHVKNSCLLCGNFGDFNRFRDFPVTNALELGEVKFKTILLHRNLGQFCNSNSSHSGEDHNWKLQALHAMNGRNPHGIIVAIISFWQGLSGILVQLVLEPCKIVSHCKPTRLRPTAGLTHDHLNALNLEATSRRLVIGACYSAILNQTLYQGCWGKRAGLPLDSCQCR